MTCFINWPSFFYFVFACFHRIQLVMISLVGPPGGSFLDVCRQSFRYKLAAILLTPPRYLACGLPPQHAIIFLHFPALTAEYALSSHLSSTVPSWFLAPAVVHSSVLRASRVAHRISIASSYSSRAAPCRDGRSACERAPLGNTTVCSVEQNFIGLL